MVGACDQVMNKRSGRRAQVSLAARSITPRSDRGSESGRDIEALQLEIFPPVKKREDLGTIRFSPPQPNADAKKGRKWWTMKNEPCSLTHNLTQSSTRSLILSSFSQLQFVKLTPNTILANWIAHTNSAAHSRLPNLIFFNTACRSVVKTQRLE
jgi:hypothetical protein